MTVVLLDTCRKQRAIMDALSGLSCSLGEIRSVTSYLKNLLDKMPDNGGKIVVEQEIDNLTNLINLAVHRTYVDLAEFFEILLAEKYRSVQSF